MTVCPMDHYLAYFGPLRAELRKPGVVRKQGAGWFDYEASNPINRLPSLHLPPKVAEKTRTQPKATGL